MLTVHAVAGPGVMGVVSSVLSQDPDVEWALRTNNVREAVSYRYRSEDLLIVDDALLTQTPGLWTSLGERTCRKILVGRVSDRGAVRRALSMQVLDMIDPDRLEGELASAVHRLIQPEETEEAWVAAVYSAKGGVGKSTVALNLAWALALYSEYDVALVDADPLGDIGAMIQDRPGATLVDIARGLDSGMSDEAALKSLYRVKALGLTVVPAAPAPTDVDALSTEDIEKVMDLLAAHHRYVVVDLATGLTDHNLTVMDRTGHIIVMAAPERVTLGGVKRATEILHTLYPHKLALLLNRADSNTGMERREIERELAHPVQYVLPSGGSAPVRSANRGRPLVLAEPKNPLAAAVIEMARNIVSAREGLRRRPRRWFGRRREG